MTDWTRAEPMDVLVLVPLLGLLVVLPLVAWAWWAIARLVERDRDDRAWPSERGLR